MLVMSSCQPLASKFTIISIQGIILLIIIVVLVISIFLYGFLIFLNFLHHLILLQILSKIC